jgi:uncharacterized protein (DUF2236 family)
VSGRVGRWEEVLASTGLFAEDSPYRRVAGEGLLLAGAAAALLLQLAHPKVARGVAEHSDFARNPGVRLLGTLEFEYAIAFGTREEAEAVSAEVRRAHERVAGPGYRADDPELLVWVNATMFATALRIYTEVFGPLTADETEELWAGARVLAMMLGCPPGAGPQTAAEFSAYWARMVRSLEVTSTARKLALAILYPPWPWCTWPVQAAARFVTAGLLPPPIRDQYGLAWSGRHQRALRAGTWAASVLYPRLPLAVRTAPKSYCIRRLRSRRSTGAARDAHAPAHPSATGPNAQTAQLSAAGS